MCGRYTDQYTLEAMTDLTRLFGDHAWGSSRPEVRPTDPAQAVTLSGDRFEVHAARWGLIPVGSSEADLRGYSTFNARAEGLQESRVFSAPFRAHGHTSGRCVIPMAAWFEWPQEGPEKVKVRLSRKDGRPLLAAGLWTRLETEEGAKFTCTMVTRDARPELAEVHARQPALLLSRHLHTWLTGSVPQARAAAMTGWPGGLIQVTRA